jgi:hypothetical protein
MEMIKGTLKLVKNKEIETLIKDNKYIGDCPYCDNKNINVKISCRRIIKKDTEINGIKISCYIKCDNCNSCSPLLEDYYWYIDENITEIEHIENLKNLEYDIIIRTIKLYNSRDYDSFHIRNYDIKDISNQIFNKISNLIK